MNNEMQELRKLIKRANQRIVQSYKDNTNESVVQKYNSTSQKFHTTNKNGIEKFTTSLNGLSDKELKQLKNDVSSFLGDYTTKSRVKNPQYWSDQLMKKFEEKQSLKKIEGEEKDEYLVKIFHGEAVKYVVDTDDEMPYVVSGDEIAELVEEYGNRIKSIEKFTI